MHLAAVITELAGAITDASSLFLVSAGLTLVFGALRIINMAHGSFYMYGAAVATTVIAAAPQLGFWLALAISPLVAAALGAAVEVAVIRRIYDREHLTQLLATFAVFLALADIGQRLWGTNERTVSPPAILAGRVTVLGASLPDYNLLVVLVAVVTGAALALLLSRTVTGWRIRAAVEDPESLAAGGTNLRLLRTCVIALGAALAGLGGAIISPLQAVGPGMDAQMIVAAFIVTVIGGLGSVAGAAIGALIIGLVETAGTLWLPSLASTGIYLVMIVVLAVRPTGLLGAPER